MSISDTVIDIVPNRTIDRLSDLADMAGPTTDTIGDVAGTVTDTVVDVADVAVDAAGRSVFRIVRTVRRRPAHAAIAVAALMGVIVALTLWRRRSGASERSDVTSAPHIHAA